jgi:hypothetical protein
MTSLNPAAFSASPQCVGRQGELPADTLNRTLDRIAAVAPDRAERAGSALQSTLAPILRSRWPEVALSFSSLTNTGFPVEFAWASRDSAVRWTSEVAPPETDDSERLHIAARLARIGSDKGFDRDAFRPDSAVAEWAVVQRSGTLRFGAWLGMRHAADDASKVYLELPNGLPDRERARHEIFRLPELTWRMAGLFPDGSSEFYAQGSLIDLDLVHRLECSAFGDAGRLTAAATMLVAYDVLPRYAGMSVSLDAEDRVLTLTWFTFAKSVFRDDEQAQSAIRGTAARLPSPPADGSLTLYDALVNGEPDGRWRHAIVGVGIGADGMGWIQAGIRPS